MFIFYTLLLIIYISCIKITNCLVEVIDQRVTQSSLLGNYSDIILDIGEDIVLECDQSNDSHTFQWYRNEENWFDPQINPKKILSNDRYLLINENKVSTVLYKCITKEYSGKSLIKSYKLYIDRLPKRERDVRNRRCLPPKCKPYAAVKEAKCNRVVLNVTYPHSQHGYNRSTNVWGNVLCNDEVGGFQIWVVGYGILKRFLPHDIILIENLIPGKAYCFNGWAYNSCGAGPVFTLEGVCAENTIDCETTSTDHCEYDFEEEFE